jgi:hypothetical protein
MSGGLTGGELLLMARPALFVESPHDQIISTAVSADAYRDSADWAALIAALIWRDGLLPAQTARSSGSVVL